MNIEEPIIRAPFAACRSSAVEWIITDGLTPYPEAVAEMEARAASIAEGGAAERVWLVEHPPLYTSGTSALAQDLIEPQRFPVFKTGRGEWFTYHGPGQRVAYVMLDLNRRRPDLRAFVSALETWIIATLSAFNMARHEARTNCQKDRRCHASIPLFEVRSMELQIGNGRLLQERNNSLGQNF